MTDVPVLEGYVTTEQAAEKLGVTKQAVHKMIDRGQFKTARKAGGPTKPFYLIGTLEVEGLVATRAAKVQEREDATINEEEARHG